MAERILAPSREEPQLTWFGHSSFLVQLPQSLSFLTDPVFSDRASPVQFAGPRRFRPTPCKVEEIPGGPPDFVLISHNHYDHLDLHVVRTLGNNTTWICPKGLACWFRSVGIENVFELDWWEELEFNQDVTITSTPAQHWSKRALYGDNMKSLWSSYAVHSKSSGKRIYFSCDTGYCPAFKETGEKLGPFDLSLIPIGAYHPREFVLQSEKMGKMTWSRFLKVQHVDPAEAVQMHMDLRSKLSVGMHWGTFLLTAEPHLEPRELLMKEMNARDLDLTSFVTMLHGETVPLSQLGEREKLGAWWMNYIDPVTGHVTESQTAIPALAAT